MVESVSGSLCKEPKDKNLSGRAYLVQRLMDQQDLSRRQATEIVNIILERMIRALKRGWEVEFPYGILVRVKRSVTYRWGEMGGRFPYRLDWQLDRAGARELSGKTQPKRGASRPRATGK